MDILSRSTGCIEWYAYALLMNMDVEMALRVI